jgi:2-haloalkanoic acid dehalogenase type II
MSLRSELLGREVLRLSEFKALTFDCYGTLIDWERGLLDVLRPWAERHRVDVNDERLLEEFAHAEAACERATPTALYPDILRAVHRRIAKRLGVPASDSDADWLAESVGNWPPFDDTVAALQQLKKTHKLAIISNVDRQSFAETNRLLQVEFDAIITAEDVGAYKPDPRVFLRAFGVLAGMGVQRNEILHVAQSLYHDHVPAQALGLTTVWVDRRRGRSGSGATAAVDTQVNLDLVVPHLAELTALD